MRRRSPGRGLRGCALAGVVAALAAVVGTGAGALLVPQPAAAQPTIRELCWYLDAMHVDEAHRISRGDGVTVAVIDSGVDSSHRDLRGQVLEGGEVGEQATDEATGDGRDDTDGHGTGMAGLIAGTGEHGANSILGIAPDAKILPVRLKQNSEGAFRPEYVYRGVRWAIDHGAKVVNMSLGGERSTDAPWKKELIRYALEKDVVLIAAAGNVEQGDERVAEPASIPGVVAVSGVTKNGSFWKGSAKGPEVVVSAPAEGLPVAAPASVSNGSGYMLADGTSGATALVSGVAALIRSAFPEASASDVVNRLIRTSEDRGTSGRDDEYGFGVVDARAALEGDVPGVNHNPLVSPEAARSDEAAAADRERSRTRNGVLIVVGTAAGGVILLLVATYLIVLARRSSRVVVAGVVPGADAVEMSAGTIWGGRPQAAPGWPPPGAPGAPPPTPYGAPPGGFPYQGAPVPGYQPQPYAPVPAGHPGAAGPYPAPAPTAVRQAVPPGPMPAPAPPWPMGAPGGGWPSPQPGAGATPQPGAPGSGPGSDIQSVTQQIPIVPASPTPPVDPWSADQHRR
ncbi:MAG: type VII secretion-associated serine protease mycosin [Micromonosporaceae bacterium]